MKIPVNENVLQALLIALNFIFALLSASLVGLGIVYIDDLSLIEIYVTKVSFLKLPIVLIILGALSFISSMVGCCIVRNCNVTFLRIYLIFLGLLLIAELTIGCMAFMNGTEPSTTSTRMKMTQLLDHDAKTRDRFYILEQHRLS
ncbi:23 kDa integral membrane protein-like [Atheta coriaria]|uniref:23 kDa integral membrane protein-like n=1 Tax=Dalotia coriaria TaxID=877792 RepID=UPI0031F38296